MPPVEARGSGTLKTPLPFMLALFISGAVGFGSYGCGSVRRTGTDGGRDAMDAAVDGGSTGGRGGGGGSVRGGNGGGGTIGASGGNASGGTGGVSAGSGGAGGTETNRDAGADRMSDGGGMGGGDHVVDGSAPDSGCKPSPESCNGLDDDCDGVVDDGCPKDQAIIGTTTGAVQSPVFGSLTQSGITKFATPCPDGQAIVALTGNAGGALDAVGVKCGVLRVHEDRATTPFTYSVNVEAGETFTPQGGTGGVAQGVDAALGCKVNEVIVGIEGWSLDVTGTCATDYCPSGSKVGCTTVYGLTVTCASYKITGAPGSFALSLSTGRVSSLAGTGEAAGRKSQMFSCTAPGALHNLDGAKGPFISNCNITVVQGLRATCTQPTLPVR